MRNASTCIVSVVAILAAAPATASAQTQQQWRGDVFGSAGGSGFSRFDDQGFDRSSDFGLGATIRLLPWLAAQVEGVKVYGLDRGSTGCNFNEPCAASSASATGLVLLTQTRVQPYLMAGLVILRSETMKETPLSATPSGAVTDTGTGPIFGGGVRVLVTRRIHVQPAFYGGWALWLSRMNLSTSRASIAVGYRW